MPNECWNHITITCDDDIELNHLFNNELIREEGLDYENKLYYYKNITIENKSLNCIIFNQLTAWKPDYEWLHNIFNKYPMCCIKNEWNVEDGTTGLWITSLISETSILVN